MDATKSLSYSQEKPMDPRLTLTAFTLTGTFLESGEMFHSFWGKEKRPEDKKSKWGIKVNFVG